jgi:hypothetical protein
MTTESHTRSDARPERRPRQRGRLRPSRGSGPTAFWSAATCLGGTFAYELFERYRAGVSTDPNVIRVRLAQMPRKPGVGRSFSGGRSFSVLLPFARYDHGSKSPFNLLSAPIIKYRDMIEDAFSCRVRF